MTRIAVVQPYVPHYRRAFFEVLGKRLREDGLDLTVIGSQGPQDRGDATVTPSHTVVRDRLGPHLGDRLRYRSVAPGSADFWIVEQALKNLETYRLLAARARGGAPVAMWGHGWTVSHTTRGNVDRLKEAFTRQASWFFAYTDEGRARAHAAGLPLEHITVVNNSLDTTSLASDLARVTQQRQADYRARYGLTEGRSALFIGRLEKDKDISFLAEVCGRLGQLDPAFTVLVGGSGAEAQLLAGLDNVRLLGPLFGEDKANAMAASSVLLIPSWIGLVAVESLVSGLPIVTRRGRSHMPEAEYLSPETTLFLANGVSAHDYAESVLELTSDSERLAEMRQQCRVRSDAYSLDAMVSNFHAGILNWVETPTR